RGHRHAADADAPGRVRAGGTTRRPLLPAGARGHAAMRDRPMLKLRQLGPGIVLALFIVRIGVTRAADWPQWRGPNRDGVWSETGILRTFPREGLKVRWRAPGGPGWSSPAVAQGRVYLTTTRLKSPSARELVLCFEEVTGKRLWSHSYEVHYPDW